ncbi:programmed cell death protein 5 [Anopheles nili]|uniref:programmed cell death protein 5 n=1 Tax=Anopheles nili TaxID=185578 RepID=UPI00237A1553|nr:programmed cell death protein 5 [Anopheles nili]
MDDAELAALRQQRLQQMQSSNPEQQQAQMEKMQAQADMKNSMLAQLLDQNARARLNTLKLSKPEKAQMVESMIIRMAQTGQIGGKLDDASLVQLLETVNQQMPRSNSTVKFDRRRAAIDSDDEDDDYGI